MADVGQPDPAKLESFREYLLLLARLRLPPRLQSKVGASDIVQQTLLKATQNIGQYRGQDESELAAWLRRILGNALVDAIREFDGAKRDVALERSLEATLTQSSARLEAFLDAGAGTPSERAIRHERVLHLSAALAKLPEDQQQALELHYLQGCTVAETAEAMARTERSIAGLVRRGLQTLRTLLDDAEHSTYGP
jgi:RNA polymerase sigma-70 factor (ECF subfamily)